MSSKYEVEVTLTSAKDLKNVNWRHGPNKPYAVVWVDPDRKVSSRVDEEGDTNPKWDQKLVIPLDRRIEDATLYIDIVHAYAEEGTKPLIGSAKLPLREVVDDGGIGSRVSRTLKLKRPSGRPHGKLEIEVVVREPRYPPPEPYGAPYGIPPPASSRSVGYGGAPYGAAAPYGTAAAPYAAAPPAGYPYVQPAYAQPAYAQPAYDQPSYGQPSYAQSADGKGVGPVGGVEEKKKSKFGGMGMGTGLAVGAVAGALGGLALAEGFDKFEDHVAEKAAEKVEDDFYDDEW